MKQVYQKMEQELATKEFFTGLISIACTVGDAFFSRSQVLPRQLRGSTSFASTLNRNSIDAVRGQDNLSGPTSKAHRDGPASSRTAQSAAISNPSPKWPADAPRSPASW